MGEHAADMDDKRDAVHEAKWAERERRRAADEAHYQRLRAEHRAEHIATVEQALDGWGDCMGGAPWSDVSAVAVDALLAAGVVFVRIGSPE